MNLKFVNWQENKPVVPIDATNHALLKNGAKATASSCGNGFDASGVINGSKSLLGWGCGNGWKSAPVSWHPNWWGEWLQVDFNREQEIDTILVYSYPQMVIGRTWASLKHYQVQILAADNEWITIDTIRHNDEDFNIVSFGKTLTKSIRVWVNRNHFREESGYEGRSGDEAPCILEIEAYGLGYEIVQEAARHEKSIEVGEKGSIAIFHDPAFEEKPSVDIEKMTAWLREWGYGVSFLTAEELCAKEVFNHDCFNVFIHPYGKYFPVGTNIYDFLQNGGHLITFGGRAFTAAKQKLQGVWTDVNTDPAITVSKARYVDYFRPYREQLGMFTVPGSFLEDVDYVKTNPSQSITHADITRQGELKGWMSLGVVGELLPVDETRQYAAEGRMPLINHTSREGINRSKSDTPLLWGDAQDEDYGCVFAYPCARWIPLINSYDRFGRSRGSIAALMPHYEGVYRGSHWAFFGVEDNDVLQWDGMDRVISDILCFMRSGVVSHSLEPSYSSYRQGEAIDFSMIIDNLSLSKRNIRLEFKIVDSNGSGEPVYSRTENLELEANTWKRLDLAWKPAHFEGDFYKLTAAVFVDGCEGDYLENGFVIWDKKILSTGPDVEFKDNYFHFGGKPRYVTGARDSGLHMPWQPEENPIRWENQYKMLRDFGMQVTSPVHLDWCIPGLGWGEFDYENPIPEILLRRMDAQVQLAQKSNLIYAPCIFFTYEKIAMQKPEIARRICEVLGERYKDVPGIIFYIFDDGLRHDPDSFNRWAKECVDGFNSCGRKFMITAEMGFRQVWPDAMRRSAKHLTFSSGSVFQQSVGDPVYERLIDMRPAGKSFTMGEFVRRIPLGTPEDFHGYLAPPHVNFGMGNAMGFNWKWATTYHTIWPSDVIFPGNNVPKKHLHAFRNEALFFRLFQPYYKSPDMMLVMPSAFWIKNSEAMTRYMVDLIRKLLEMRVDFACIDDEDIDMLPETVKAVIVPVPLELPEYCYAKIKAFAEKGGKVFVIGDLGKQDTGSEGSSSAEWLEELCGVISKGYVNAGMTRGHSLFMNQFMRHQPVDCRGREYTANSRLNIEPGRAKTVLQARDGSPVVTCLPSGLGKVWFMNDLGTDFQAGTFQDFFEDAGVCPMDIKPDLPTFHCFKINTYSGPVYTMFTFPWDTGRLDVELATEAGRVELVLKNQTFGIVAMTKDEKGVGALETQGRVTLNGRELVDTDTHIMLAALDQADIFDSSALLLLPILKGTARIESRTADRVESGELVGGKWKAYSSRGFQTQDGVYVLNVEMEDPTALYLIYDSKERAKAVKLIETNLY